jgi:hypothetical protein
MSRYRQTSFDPNAYDQPGPALRPFNWVQWTGVALQLIGGALILLFIAGKLGWIPHWIDDLSPGPIVLMLIGAALINSRRAPGTPIDEQQRERNKRTLVITLAICAVILGGAFAIEFLGD